MGRARRASDAETTRLLTRLSQRDPALFRAFVALISLWDRAVDKKSTE